MPGALGRIALVVLFVSCLPYNPQIIAGRSPFAGQPIVAAPDDDSLIRQLRSTIEWNRNDSLHRNDYLYHLARRFFDLEPGVTFTFSYCTAVDSNNLVLRYFGPIPRPGRYAGYSIQFLYDRGRRRVGKIFVERVPLE